MYRLTEFLHDVWHVEPTTKCELLCAESNVDNAFSMNLMHDTLACYSYNLVVDGWVEIASNGHSLVYRRNDFYFSTPGSMINIIKASDDYRGLSILADQSMTLEIPMVRHMIRAAYFPLVVLREPRLSLTDDQANHFYQLMQMIISYKNSSHMYKDECLRMLYSVFLLDLQSIRNRKIPNTKGRSESAEKLFIDFIQLLPENFIDHHDIAFYANRLNITPIYLSRVVKKVSGQTVVDYINQMLFMEGAWLLQKTDNSIAQIAEYLHFSDQASFTKFFSRMKGMTPKAYRMNR
ncbi:MAG: helix-turn-helix domain-containing protein [Prevotella sp.]|nr:helix-turn-helix domain-containing protein [Prevotella sp.]